MDVLFDIDGTLVRTYPREDEFYDAALQTIGLSLPTTDYLALGASTDVSILRVLAQRAWEREPTVDEIERVREEHTRAWRHHLDAHSLECVPGAHEILNELRERGVRFAAATGGFRQTAQTKLRAAKLSIEIAGAAEDGRGRTALLAHAAGGQTPMYIGDGKWDLEAATANGFAFVGVATDPETHHFGSGVSVISDLRRVIDHL